MCTTPAQVLESLSGMFGNATDIDGNATKQMMMGDDGTTKHDRARNERGNELSSMYAYD
jgi:hypothetical protein